MKPSIIAGPLLKISAGISMVLIALAILVFSLKFDVVRAEGKNEHRDNDDKGYKPVGIVEKSGVVTVYGYNPGNIQSTVILDTRTPIALNKY